jgi:hypothetical protein
MWALDLGHTFLVTSTLICLYVNSSTDSTGKSSRLAWRGKIPIDILRSFAIITRTTFD